MSRLRRIGLAAVVVMAPLLGGCTSETTRTMRNARGEIVRATTVINYQPLSTWLFGR